MSQRKSGDPVQRASRAKRAHPRSPIQRQKRAIAQKRGLGSGEDYQSFIRVERHDFGSYGRSHIWLDPLGSKLVAHLLGDLERYVLMCLSAAGGVVRSQYPLWRAGVEAEFIAACESTNIGTVHIAEELGFKHPVVQGEHLILTQDLLAKFPCGSYLAIYVKYECDLPPVGTRGYELYKVAKEYWHRRNVELLVVTERDLKDGKVYQWLDWASSIRGSYSAEADQHFSDLVSWLIEQTDEFEPMNARIKQLGQPRHTVVLAIKYALWTGRIAITGVDAVGDLTQVWTVKQAPMSDENRLNVLRALATEL